MFTIRLLLISLITISASSFAASPLSSTQADELTKLYQNYSGTRQVALAARKQVEQLQTEIVARNARLAELQDKADHAETDLMELQEFDRKKPGKVKPEELEAARNKHLQARAAVDSAQSQLEHLKSQLTQASQDFSNKKLADEHSIAAYRTRFEELASESVTRRVNSYKVPQQITESASVPCEDLAIGPCKTKTQQEAQRRAIEKGAIIVVNSITEIKNLALQKDEVSSEVHGEISNLKILETRLTDEPATYFMKIQATVTPAIGGSLLKEIQRTVRADMSLQVGDGGLAFNSMEVEAIEPLPATASDNATQKYKDYFYYYALEEKAQQGNTQAQYEVGVMYEYGLRIIKNVVLPNGDNIVLPANMADADIQSAIEKNYPEYRLLSHTSQPNLFGAVTTAEVDGQRAVSWYEKAAAKGHIAAQGALGERYVYSSGTKLNKAVSLLKASAAKGDARAMRGLATAYCNGWGMTKDKAKAGKWAAQAILAFEKLAQQGDPVAQLALGGMYDTFSFVSNCSPTNEAKALSWYERAATQGLVHAQFQLGFEYENGVGVQRDDAKAFAWYQKAAALGDANAQNKLGKMYANGIGVQKDEAQAVVWYAKAAVQGVADAQVTLAYMYQNGTGMQKDEAKAFEWFWKAAAQGVAEAENMLGVMYQFGTGVQKDEAQAIEWYKKSALKLNSVAQNNLGTMYEIGTGIPKNAAKAVEWYTKSAMQGNADAQYNLGKNYYLGEGLAKDLVLSYAWLNLSTAQGDMEAGKLRDSITLTPVQRAEAERMSSSWKFGDVLRRSKK